MKKVIVVATDRRMASYYCSELRHFFGDDLRIDHIASTDKNIRTIQEYDMVMITTHTVIEKIKPFVGEKSKIIKIVKNLSPKGTERINDIPYGVEALVVNVGPKTVSESIYLIYSYGRTDLELHPYYPGIEKYEELGYILTQGETDIVPDYGAKVIDILDTTIDSRIYLEIISHFELPKRKYLGKLMERNSIRSADSDGISIVVSERFMLENIINVLFENLNEGVLIYDDVGIATSSSDSISQLLGKPHHNIIGKKITDVIPIRESEIFGTEPTEMVIDVNRIPLIYNVVPKMTLGCSNYGLVLLKRYTDTEKAIHGYKKRFIDRGHMSKYRIDDIVGSSMVMQKIKAIATRMARSSSTVIIMGESGTGKELFAHAIHNQSKRSKEQFVAVNCSAIPENLLESELFGYEDGAFTGAKRGGKRGLFEVANNGTLFLDEIGEIPLHLQNRLLRVLQEKEIMRIGGDSIINIDVRIIAATNIDLKKHAEAGKFRKDLYYRLSVLPLVIPPLRQREGDVLEIFKALLMKKGEHLVLDKDVEIFFLNYDWEGNIRELQNCIEYLLNFEKSVIEIEDLPDNMTFGPKIPSVAVKLEERPTKELILQIIHDRSTRHLKSGRKSIADELEKFGVFLGEQEIRAELIGMQDGGFVEIRRGRGGTIITNQGRVELMSHWSSPK